MNFRQLASLILVAAAAGSGGYFLRSLQTDSPSGMSPVENYLCPQSFSEVENTKALLDALAKRYLCEVFVQATTGRQSPLGDVSESAKPRSQAAAIRILKAGVAEFAGTEQELLMMRFLLKWLRRDKLYGRWLDVYLRTLYQHPTHPLIGDFVGDAVAIGKATGRSNELRAGFRHLLGIPLDFEAKHRVEAALLEPPHGRGNSQVAR